MDRFRQKSCQFSSQLPVVDRFLSRALRRDVILHWAPIADFLNNNVMERLVVVLLPTPFVGCSTRVQGIGAPRPIPRLSLQLSQL
jgi:hypothetical protein